MAEQGLKWLVGYSDFLRIHFQNWMPVMAAIVVLELLYLCIRQSFGRKG